jgi:hypothetical protein
MRMGSRLWMCLEVGESGEAVRCLCSFQSCIRFAGSLWFGMFITCQYTIQSFALNLSIPCRCMKCRGFLLFPSRFTRSSRNIHSATSHISLSYRPSSFHL